MTDQNLETETLAITLTQGAVDNGYIRLPPNQTFFPSQFVALGNDPPTQQFDLILPNGEVRKTCVLAEHNRIQLRFYSVFKQLSIHQGDKAILAKDEKPNTFRLSFVSNESAVRREIPNNGMQKSMTDIALNQIFYGPPGTGKTFAMVNRALEILDAPFAEEMKADRSALKRRFDEFVTAGDVQFVTFHQSFSYEDFVEGIRAQPGPDGQLVFDVTDGIFKSICSTASARVTQHSETEAVFDLAGRRIWKMSLGNSLGEDSYIFEECIENDYALLGWGGQTDFSSCVDRDTVFERFISDGKNVSKDAYPVTAVTTFLLKVQKGDILIVSEGNSKFRAIGEVTGDYRVLNRNEQGDDYGQCRNVKWLRVYEPSLPDDQLMNNKFSQMTLYQLRPNAIDIEKLLALLTVPTSTSSIAAGSPFKIGEKFGTGYEVVHVSTDIVELVKPNKRKLPIGMSLLRELAAYVANGKLSLTDIKEKKVFERLPDSLLEPWLVNGYENILYHLVERLVAQEITTPSKSASSPANSKVLIIDEINRGNVSRVFGELITLIEPSKRRGANEALEVILPYSKKRFSVPSNVYILGTMNTADRSLSALDIALRRRFTFVEMSPEAELLEQTEIQGLNVGELLAVMNNRIEALLDRDHRLGHAYFLPLRDDPTLERLASIFRDQIVPLLQEYFFEDWTRIQMVLNDHRKSHENCFVIQSANNALELFGEQSLLNGTSERWVIKEEAFGRIEAYVEIIDASRKPSNVATERQANVGEYTVKQLATGTIEVWRNGTKLGTTKPTLMEIAKGLDVDTLYVTGTLANTRELGKRVLNALSKNQS